MYGAGEKREDPPISVAFATKIEEAFQFATKYLSLLTISVCLGCMLLTFNYTANVIEENKLLKSSHRAYGLNLNIKEGEMCLDVLTGNMRHGERNHTGRSSSLSYGDDDDQNIKSVVCTERDHVREHAIRIIEQLYRRESKKIAP